jgi:hypothetical protein
VNDSDILSCAKYGLRGRECAECPKGLSSKEIEMKFCLKKSERV